MLEAGPAILAAFDCAQANFPDFHMTSSISFQISS
jgi:hypothetical protein